MIEVLFGESEAGAMRMAARKYKKKLGNDVICLAFLLDIGNIQEAVDSTYRKNFIFNFYALCSAQIPQSSILIPLIPEN